MTFNQWGNEKIARRATLFKQRAWFSWLGPNYAKTLIKACEKLFRARLSQVAVKLRLSSRASGEVPTNAVLVAKVLDIHAPGYSFRPESFGEMLKYTFLKIHQFGAGVCILKIVYCSLSHP